MEESKNKANSRQEITSNNNNAIIDETTTLTKQQKNQFAAIIIIIVLVVVIPAGILYKPDEIHKNVSKPLVDKHEKKRSPEIIFTEIKKALKDNSFETCKNLFNEMQNNYPKSIIFDSIKIIYDSAMNIVQLKKEEARKKRKTYESNKKRETKQAKQSKYLKVFAQAYSDGAISCNVYLADKSGNIYYLDASSINISIFSYSGNRIFPTQKINANNTSSGLYLDIPMGNKIIYAEKISLVIATRNGTIYKSDYVQIER